MAGHLCPCEPWVQVMCSVERKAEGDPVEELPTIVMRTSFGKTRRVTFMGFYSEGVPEEERLKEKNRRETQENAGEPRGVCDAGVHSKTEDHARDVLYHITPGQPSMPSQPESPVKRQNDRANRDLPFSSGLHELIRILTWNVGGGVMLEMFFTENRERDDQRKNGKAAPPDIGGPGSSKMSVRTFMRHDRGDKLEVRSRENVDNVLDRTGGLPEVTAKRHRHSCQCYDAIDYNGAAPVHRGLLSWTP